MFEETEVHSHPIDCFAIAEKLRYVLRPYSSLCHEEQQLALAVDQDGYSRVEIDIFTGMNVYVIYYNDEGRNIGRIRWTIFHEIGHIYLGHHDHPDDELSDIELDKENLGKIAGGGCYPACPNDYCFEN